jgi:RimJ/RimL family protein N-acetyltransferase
LRRLDNGELVGDIGLHFLPDDDRQVELGVTVSPRHQRGGLATEATSAVIEFLFRDLQKHRVMASVDPANEAVRRLLDRLGFRQEAHFRQSLRVGDTWVDDMIYAVLRSEWTR